MARTVKHTLLITGASGYLAHRLVPLASAMCGRPVIGLARHEAGIVAPAQPIACDITEPASLSAVFQAIRPTAVIHAAACNPGQDDATMEAINAFGAANVARAANAAGARLVMVSTDIVHNGRHAPYADDAEPAPVNQYGTSKAQGERAVLSLYPQALVARTSLIYGLEKVDRGTEGFIQRLNKGEPLSLFSDVIRQPIWIDSLATALCELALNRPDVCGLLNLAGKQAMSRADFALAMLAYWQLKPAQDQIRLVSAAEFATVPLDCRLDLQRATQLGLTLPGVDQVLSARLKS